MDKWQESGENVLYLNNGMSNYFSSVLLPLVKAENLYSFNIKHLHYNKIDTVLEVGCAGMPLG